MFCIDCRIFERRTGGFLFFGLEKRSVLLVWQRFVSFSVDLFLVSRKGAKAQRLDCASLYVVFIVVFIPGLSCTAPLAPMVMEILWLFTLKS
ncbi:hypothetical protein B4N84_23150 [Flavobacterium sp. IR1]|nr:hypothetical protein B4N84_23150 [Flavobacterium sp. IR1]